MTRKLQVGGSQIPAFPNIQVQIVEGHEACSEHLVPFADAPDPS